MPIKTFWMLHRNIQRIEAAQDMRQAELVVRTQSSEGIQGLFGELQRQLDQPIVFDGAPPARTSTEDTLDKEGLDALRFGLG
jgi:hypothetical protein